MRYELAAEAAGWLFSDMAESRDEEKRYTFLHICFLLGLNAKAVREHALTLTREDLHRFSADAGPT
jgi:hypothetical protein